MATNTSYPKSTQQYRFHTRMYFFLLFAILLTIVTIINNTLVVLAYKINRRLHNRAILILVSLAWSDLLVGAIAMPLWMYMTVSRHRMPSGLYVFYMSVDVFSAFASILHLMWVSIERFLAIAYPLRHRRFGDKGYKAMLLMIWLLAAFFAALFPVQYYQYWHKEYAVIVFTNGFVFPLVSITVVYTAIYNIANSGVFKGVHLKGTRSFQAEKKLAKTVFVLCFMFFITWCPFFIVSMLGTFTPELLSLPSPEFGWYITVFVKAMHYSNSALNTFVYAFSSKEMRKTFNCILRCKKNIVFPNPVRRTRRKRHTAQVFNLHTVDSL